MVGLHLSQYCSLLIKLIIRCQTPPLFSTADRSGSPSIKSLDYLYVTLAEKGARVASHLERAIQGHAEESRKIKIFMTAVAILQKGDSINVLISGEQQARSILKAAGSTLTDIKTDEKHLEGALRFAMEYGEGTLVDDITDSTVGLPSIISKMVSVNRLPNEIPDDNETLRQVEEHVHEIMKFYNLEDLQKNTAANVADDSLRAQTI